VFDELCCLGIVFPLGDHFGLEPPCELAQERGPESEQSRMARSRALAASDTLAPKQSATRPAARRRPLSDTENFGGEVSFEPPSRSRHSITSSARASNESGTSRPSVFAVLRFT